MVSSNKRFGGEIIQTDFLFSDLAWLSVVLAILVVIQLAVLRKGRKVLLINGISWCKVRAVLCALRQMFTAKYISRFIMQFYWNTEWKMGGLSLSSLSWIFFFTRCSSWDWWLKFTFTKHLHKTYNEGHTLWPCSHNGYFHWKIFCGCAAEIWISVVDFHFV